MGDTTTTTISPLLIAKFLDLLTPLAGSEAERRGLLIRAFGTGHVLERKIDFSGNADTFVTHLINTLYWYGTIETGEAALVVLLESVKREVGGDKQEQVEAVLAPIRGLALPAKIFRIPHHPNHYFTGREAELKQVAKILATGKAAALTGLGGIGKTQIAVEFCYRQKGDYRYVFWINAETEDTLRIGFVNILRQVNPGLVQPNDDLANTEAAQHWLASNAGWLIVLDNADTVEQAHPYIPSHGQGHVLLTSRPRNWRNFAEKVEIARFAEEEGATLLLRCAELIQEGQVFSDADLQSQSLARAFSREVDGLALALDQAGAFILETGTSLGEYYQLYMEQGAELRAEQAGISPTEHGSVGITFHLALKKIKKSSPAAAQLMEYSAFLAPEAIPEILFTKGASESDIFTEPLSSAVTNKLRWSKAVGVLHNYSLIERSPETSTFSLHRVAQEAIRDGMSEEMQKQYIHTLVQAMLTAYPGEDYRQWGECERLLPHWRAIGQHIGKYNIQSEQVAWLFNQTGYYLNARGLYSETEPLYEKALKIQESIFGKEHPYTAVSINNLALLYKDLGRFDRAEPLYEQVLQIWESTLGNEHPNTAQILNNLASLYKDSGKFDKAEPLYERALQIWKSTLGNEHPNTAQILNNLANLYKDSGELEKAEPLFEQALHIWESTMGNEHPNTAQILNNLAELYVKQGKFEKAEPLHEQALKIRESVLGKQHPRTAESLNNLALLYNTQGKFEKTESLLEQALKTLETVLGKEHPNTITARENLNSLRLEHRTLAQLREFIQTRPNAPDTSQWSRQQFIQWARKNLPTPTE